LYKLASTLVAAGALAAAAVFGGAHSHTPTALSADVAPAPVAGSEAPWSAPAVLSACPAAFAAHVVFPSDSPTHATGPGAIVWGDSAHCPDGEGARVAVIAANDAPGPPSLPRTAAGQPLVPHGALLASGAPHGQIVIAGAAAPVAATTTAGLTATVAPGTRTTPAALANALLIQGAAAGPFTTLDPSEGASSTPIALTSGYLGDVALVAPPAGRPDGGRVNVHVERFYEHTFTRNVTARAAAGGPVQGLTLAMDYRSETLAVWAQRGAIYARLVTQSGAAHQLQRLAAAGSDPVISALLSDDHRAIVAWSEQRGDETAVYLDRSAPGARFAAAPQLLERFPDPDSVPAPAASPSLVRLSSESVMLAWAGAVDGHWVVRIAPIELNGLGDTDTLAATGTDALLAGLAAGPYDNALALWTEPLPTAAGPPDMQRQEIFAATGIDSYPRKAVFAGAELLAPPAPVSGATVAFDPADGRAIAVWQGEAGATEYSIRASAAGP
jgi:hypothetical protein